MNISINLSMRITPARAGTTPEIRIYDRDMKDHPRSRGNHCGWQILNFVYTGSPPLAREPPFCTASSMIERRITPARAGTTVFPVPVQMDQQDHPRSRGNHPYTRYPLQYELGSPPLAREPPGQAGKLFRRKRITPARAGTTAKRILNWKKTKDHPRSRGNHIPSFFTFFSMAGSPPLAREPPGRYVCRVHDAGITPARAGTTA